MATEKDKLELAKMALNLMTLSPKERLAFCEKHNLIDKSKWGLEETWSTDNHWIRQIARDTLKKLEEK